MTDTPIMRRAAGLLLALVALPGLAWATPAPGPLADARAARTKKLAPRPMVARETPSDLCEGIRVGPEARSPFAPGEELTYDLSISGLYLGKIELKAGRPRMVDGRRAESFFGRARTSGFASALKTFAGRYMSVVEPALYQPLELRSEATYGDDPRHEIARFSTDHRNVSANFRMNGKNADRSYARNKPVYDMLTLLYYSRRLALTPGTKLCQEVYADKRLWRADAEVVGKEVRSTPVGERAVIKVTTRWVRLPHADFDPKREPPSFDVDMCYTDDVYRAPVAFIARTKDFTAEANLVRWSSADRSTGSAEASGWSF